MKICSICKISKSIIEFNKGITRDGLYSYCKSCHKKYNYKNREHIKSQTKSYREKHSQEIKNHKKVYYLNNKEKILDKTKKYAQEHKKQQNLSKMNWNLKNPEKRKQASKKYYQTHKKERNLQRKSRRNADIGYKILNNLRRSLTRAIKDNLKTNNTKNLIGCSIEQLKQHLKSKFQVGMNWNNYNYYGWHIDHIRPCASFDLSKESEQRKCFHYTNLQPLWANDNFSKGSKVNI